MFKIKVSENIITHCEKEVQQYNFGQRATANGTKEQQLTGIIGQSTIMNLFNLGNVKGSDGFDDGVDLIYKNRKIDVKTMGRTTEVKPSYTNNFLKVQDCFNTDVYIFCSYHKNKKELTVCGLIDKNTFIKRRTFYPKGTERTRTNGTSFKTFADLYEIDNTSLIDVIDIDELKNNIMVTLDEIERRFNDMDIPETPIAIRGGIINNPRMFILSHISYIRGNPKNKTYRPYYDRLLYLLDYFDEKQK